MYSKDYQEIKKVFYEWIKAWEDGRIKDMKECCVPDIRAYFSMFDPCDSWDGLEKCLKKSAGKKTDNWFEILSFVALTDGVNAQQSANMIALKTLKDENKFTYYQFAGLFCNSYIKTEKGWKISECRFDLFREDGNMEMAGDWHHMDPKIGWYEGIRLPVIFGALDAPWVRITKRDSVGTDEEQIEEAFYRYAFALDTCTFSLMKDVLDENIKVIMPPFGMEENPMDKRAFMTTLMTHRHTERFMQHTGEFQSVEFNASRNQARVLFYRKGDSGVTPVPVLEDNIYKKIGSAIYQINMKKGQDAIWRIEKLIYQGKAFYYD